MIYLIIATSKLHKDGYLNKIARDVWDIVSKYGVRGGFKISDPAGIVIDRFNNASAFIILSLTGGSEEVITEFAKFKKPIVIVAHSSDNSLASSIEAYSLLRYQGIPSCIVRYEDRYSFEENFHYYGRVLNALDNLYNARIVLFGDPSPWLVYSNMQLDIIKSLFNLKISKIDLSELVDEYNKVSDVRVEDCLKIYRNVELIEPNDSDLTRSIRLYLAMRSILDKYNAKLASIRCFDLIKYRLTPCLAVSFLNNEGYDIACEGDIPSLITMYFMRLISGNPSFMANLVWHGDSELIFAHCTAPTKMLIAYRFRSHYESGIGLSIEGEFREGVKTTFAKIDFINKTIFYGLGLVARGSPFLNRACRTQISIDIGSNTEAIYEICVGNHFILSIGDYTKYFKALSRILGFQSKYISRTYE